jgi:hypothetical protein
MSKTAVAFKPDEMIEARKDFRGIIIDADYGDTPLGIEGAPGFVRRPQLAIKISTEAYEREQIEWYAPSNKKKTRWAAFIEAMSKCGALKETKPEGVSDDDKLKSFAKSLIGMDCHFVELEVEVMGQRGKSAVILPDEYYGRREVTGEVKTETVGANLG